MTDPNERSDSNSESDDRPLPEEPPDSSWSVAGYTDEPGSRRLSVEVWVRGVTNRTLAARGVVDPGGAFHLTFRDRQLQPGVVDFAVVVVEEVWKRTGDEVLVSDAPRETVLDQPLRPPSPSYEDLRHRLAKILIGMGDVDAASTAAEVDVDDVIALAEQDSLETIAHKMSVDVAELHHLRAAVRASPLGLPTSCAYVLARAGVALNLESLAGSEPDVRKAVDDAISEGLVDADRIGAGDGPPGESMVAQIRDLALLRDLDRPVVSGGVTPRELLVTALGETDDAELLDFARFFGLYDVLDERFWIHLDNSGWRTAADRSALRRVLWLETVTLSSLPLIRYLAALEPQVTPERALGFTADDWASHIVKADSPDEPAVPGRFGTGEIALSRQDYIAAIMARLRRSLPVEAARALVRQVAAEAARRSEPNPLGGLAKRLSRHPELDVVGSDFSADPNLLREQRLVQQALADNGRDPIGAAFALAAATDRPAHAVARMGLRAFIDQNLSDGSNQ